MKMEANPETIFDVMCETNNKHVKEGIKTNILLVYFKDGVDNLYEIKNPKNPKDKSAADTIRNNAKLNGVDAYIVIRREIINKQEYVIRALYTEQNKIIDVISINDEIITRNDRLHGRDNKIGDEYDIWRRHQIIIHVDLDKNKEKKQKNNNIKRFEYKTKRNKK